MSVVVQDLMVRKSIVVNAPQAHVFRTFTEGIDTWWPRPHHIGGKEPYTAILEPRAGGRFYERAHDGSECDWGRVLAWEPTSRVLLSWDINADWKYQEGFGTEVEVRFAPEGKAATRVVLEHRKLERYGDKAEMMRALLDGVDAWMGTLTAFTAVAQKSQDGAK